MAEYGHVRSVNPAADPNVGVGIPLQRPPGNPPANNNNANNSAMQRNIAIIENRMHEIARTAHADKDALLWTVGAVAGVSLVVGLYLLYQTRPS